MPVHRSGKRRAWQPVPEQWREKELLAHTAEIPVPAKACIVGCGPAGAGQFHKTAGYTLIALNSAITFPLAFDYWMLYDENSRVQAWFKHKLQAQTKALMGKYVADDRATYIFDVRRRMSDGLIYQPGEFLNGATVAGVAATWLEMIGCKEIAFFACDFYGPTNLDGSSAGGRPGKWNTHAKWMNRLLGVLAARGVKLYTLTPSMLNLPMQGDY